MKVRIKFTALDKTPIDLTLKLPDDAGSVLPGDVIRFKSPIHGTEKLAEVQRRVWISLDGDSHFLAECREILS